VSRGFRLLVVATILTLSVAVAAAAIWWAHGHEAASQLVLGIGFAEIGPTNDTAHGQG
jgi:flagellar biosynthesis component FlhA